IFVLSTGTSLRGFDFHRLDGRITVGVNRIIEHYQPAVMTFVDVTAHKTHARALVGYNGMIVAGRGAAPPDHDNVFEIEHHLDARNVPAPHIGRSFSEGWFGGGGGCVALHTAILLGGNPIYLLGYDFYEDHGRHFDVYDSSLNAPDLAGLAYTIAFDCLERIAQEDWVPTIYNCNPRSRLRCFPFADIDAVLADDPELASAAGAR
ncbi:MAG: hypothetical protein JOZ54_10970, partial [Acidobacteria bacterium]|nr:hypothetical protein [Acidobacteriota bacterium]